MIKTNDLRSRKWPTRAPPLSPEDSHNYVKGAYVTEGKIILRPLGQKSGFGKPIPPGESAITSLALGPNGRVFGATSGDKAHLFVYDPSPGEDYVRDCGVIGEKCEVKNALVACSDGRLFAGTKPQKPSSGCEGKLFCYDPEGQSIGAYGHIEEKIEAIVTPTKSEGIAALAIDDERKRIYGLSSPSGAFFIYHINSEEVEAKGKVDETGVFSEVLLVDKNGFVYGGRRSGRLFRYDANLEKIEFLDVQIPSLTGRTIYNKIDSLALDEHTGRIYGGGTADGVLFAFDPVEQTMISLGKPLSQPRIRALTVGHDGVVYGVGGYVGGMSHLFRYNPETGDLRDLGIPLATSQRYWHGYEFDAMITGSYGEICLGESDRISHLFIYFPPIPKRRNAFQT